MPPIQEDRRRQVLNAEACSLTAVRIRDDAMRPAVPGIEGFRGLRRVLQVEPEDDHVPTVLLDELAHHPRLARAGVAPGGPDVNDYRLLLHARESDRGARDRVGAGKPGCRRIDPDGFALGSAGPSL